MSDRKINSISEHIYSLLEDSSFPPLVMLDGNWGEGKTYFTKNVLIPDLESKGEGCVFFSLTGLSSISDFRDRLLSSNYVKKEITEEHGRSLTSLVTPLVKLFGGENGGLTASILSGASGLIKESMLSRMKDRVIIIDDLDRVSDGSLCDLIIGECLQLTEKCSLKFIFVVNDKKSSANLALKEKIFSGIVKLNRTLDESIEVAFCEYDWYGSYKDIIVRSVSNKNIRNIRILKRMSKKIEEIYRLIKSEDSLDLNLCMNEIIPLTIMIMYYHYEKGMSVDEILNNSELHNVLPSEKRESYEFKDLVEAHFLLTKELISYYVGGSNWKVSINDFGRLPRRSCPIDSFIFSGLDHYDDDEFEGGLILLEEFIFEGVDVPFSKWFEASYFYYHLQSKEFLPSSRKELTESVFEEVCKRKHFDYSDLNGRACRLKIDADDNYIYQGYISYRSAYIEIKEKGEKIDIFERMKKSWLDVDEEVYKNYRLEPFFNQFSIKQLSDCIDCWTNKDLQLFRDFIQDRYKVSNIQSYLSDELSIIKLLEKEVGHRKCIELPGRRKGSLGLLNKSISSAVKSLTPKT